MLADVGERRRRPAERARRGTAHDRARAGREELPAERRDRDAGRPPARLAPARAPLRGRRRAGLREPVRLRPLRLPQRARAARPRDRPVLLPPEARGPPRGAALEPCLRARRGRARPRPGLDSRDRPDRDRARGVRDGRDPLRAPRPHHCAERRTLGLHLQPDQEAPRPGRGPAGPPAGLDDGAVHARLYRAARAHVPPAGRARDRWHGGFHPVPPRRRGERGRAPEGAGGQGSGSVGRLRRHVGRAPRPGPGGARAVRAAEPARSASRGRRDDRRPSSSTCAFRAAR